MIPITEYSLLNLVWVLAAVAIAASHQRLLSRELAASSTDSPKTAAKPVSVEMTERRKSPRRYGNPITIYVSISDSDSEPMVGTVTDRSPGGLGISSENAFEIGTILLVRPVKSINLTPRCQIEVLACRHVGSGWRLNCRFLSPLPDSLLLLFG
jgi:hypothetical protein